MNDVIYITYETFTDIINLLDKTAHNIELCRKNNRLSFIRSFLEYRSIKKCQDMAMSDIIAESVNMIERLFDETAPQIQFIVLPEHME